MKTSSVLVNLKGSENKEINHFPVNVREKPVC